MLSCAIQATSRRSSLKTLKTLLCSTLSATIVLLSSLAAWAAPPVRIAIVPGGGSGMEQEVCDRIVDRVSDNPNIRVGTVNPDWTATVNIADKSDLMAQTTRVNGTLTIKTRDGHVIDTISVQANKQDFNLNPGTPAPMNKALVESAVREVISKLIERAISPIETAVATEIDTRDKIIQAHNLADDDKYEQALDLLKQITPETPHFKGVRELIAEYQMEMDALDLMNQAKANVKVGKVASARAQLKAISRLSKRYRAAQQMLAALNRGAPPRVAKSASAAPASNAQLKALQEQKKALQQQQRAIEAQEAALMRKSK
jgi:hypothetical protein